MEFIRYFHGKPHKDRKIPLIGKAEWDKFEDILNQVYRMRNWFLHSGQPFPPDMCGYPYLRLSKKKMSLIERPVRGTTFYGPETIIKSGDQPLLLWKFEEIVRKSLLKWILTVK